MSTKTLVLAEDDGNLRQLYTDFLSAHGYYVMTAENGLGALSLLHRVQPRLILLDVMMPKLDGFEVCSRIQKIKPNAATPVVMVTALDSLSDMAKATESGAQWLVNKPYDSHYLLSVVNHRVAAKV